MSQHERHRRAALKKIAVTLAATMLCSAFPACKAFKVDVGTSEPIRLDPIKFEPINVHMRVDLYQFTGGSQADPKAVQSIKEAVEGQRNRMEQVQDLKNSRWVGENHLGLLSIRNLPAGTDGAWVQKTIDEENADRDFIMNDKVKNSKTPITTEEVRRKQWEIRTQTSFGGEWIEIQVPGEKEGTFTYEWVQKPETQKEIEARKKKEQEKKP